MNATVTNFSDDELLGSAEPYALYALDPDEVRAVDAALRTAAPEVREQFADRARDAQETMAAQAGGFTERPAPGGFDRIVAQLGPTSPASAGSSVSPLRKPDAGRRRVLILAGAAAAVVAIAVSVVAWRSIGSGSVEPAPAPGPAVLAAGDARTEQARVGSATITFTYSHERNAGVVRMEGVAAPSANSVYQMWLIDPDGTPHSRGMMVPADIRPETTAVVPDIGAASTFGVSVEAPGGAQRPTPGKVLATIPIHAT